MVSLHDPRKTIKVYNLKKIICKWNYFYTCTIIVGKKVQKRDQMRVHDWKPRNGKQENNYVQPFFSRSKYE